MTRSTQRLRLAAASVLTLAAIGAPPALAQQSVEMDELADRGAQLYQRLSFADLVEKVSPAVVSIRTEREVETRFQDLPPELERLLPGLRDRFGGLDDGETRRAMGQGSGFFINDEGNIVTNNHVVEGAEEITVVLNDGTEMPATLVGTDPETDLAVLKVKPTDEQRFVKFSPKADLRVGDYVLAVGNPFGLGGTVTSGIVSALGRESGPQIPYADFIQIDASINRGNSGGPTFDVNGNVIGVNTAIISPTGVNAGIGLAIPATVAQDVVNQIIEEGSVSRGFLGVSVRDPEPQILEALGLEDETGALIANVTDGSPAAQAGLQAGDIVTQLDGKPITNSTELTRTVGGYEPGEEVRLRAIREGKERTFKVELERRPSQRMAGSMDIPQQSESETTERLGVSFRALDDAARRRLGVDGDVEGVLISDVDRESEAAAAGILPGMIVIEADNRKVSSPGDIERAVEAAKRRDRGAILLRVQTRQGLDFRALPINS